MEVGDRLPRVSSALSVLQNAKIVLTPCDLHDARYFALMVSVCHSLLFTR